MSQMQCPKCGEKGTNVIQTRPEKIKVPGVTRTQKCKNVQCGFRFTTIEVPIGVLDELSGEDLQISINDGWEIVKAKLRRKENGN